MPQQAVQPLVLLEPGAPGGPPLPKGSGLGGLVDAVQEGSLAEEAGVRPGMRVLAVNGHGLRDVVDYQYHATEERIELALDTPEGPRSVVIDKWPDEDIGIAFDTATFDGTRICANKCVFCFLKGLPKGLRRTLYVKDDDYRLSFLHGNFVTLTNLDESDWQRLAEQRLSPLNVSVHVTDTALRRAMLGYQQADDILEQLRRLGSLGIRCNTQIVLCPGVNDGEYLLRSVTELAALYPIVQSVSVVPVGATMQYEERMSATGHDNVDACDPDYARAVVKMLRPLQRELRRRLHTSLVYIADEYYLTAGERVPGAALYDGFEQYENGIGMTRRLIDDCRRAQRLISRRGVTFRPMRVTIACGALIAPVLRSLADEVTALTGLQFQVVPVENTLFGPRINVSGLLGAADIIGALRAAGSGEIIVLPRTGLDYFGRHFLDDGTPADIERVIGCPVAYASYWSELLDQVLDFQESAKVEAPGAGRTTNGKFWSTGG
jgi:putative radical SAM enzyme (TIGR03279 family)